METAVKEEYHIFPDPPGLARGAAAILAAAAAEAAARGDRFSLVLPGGSTPRLLFRLLGAAYGDSIGWDRIHLFWTDERAVPPDHDESNFGMARAEMIARVAIPPGNIHRIMGEMPPAEAAAAYEADLKNHFGGRGMPDFDLVFLGVGEDGHTASLFPGSDALTETERLAVPVFSAPAHPRVTLTLPVLNNARRIVFLVSGPAKAGIVRAILAGESRTAYPAGRVGPAQGTVAWLLDREAARGLRQTP